MSLISGRTVSVQTETDATVDHLKQAAQSGLLVGRATLVTSSGLVLDGASTIGECDLQSGDLRTLQVRQLQIQATRRSQWNWTAAVAQSLTMAPW